MDFRTELIVPKARRALGIGEPVLTLGSCFAQSMGQRFLDNKFRALVNPFGTTYHPVAIHRLLHYVTHQEYPLPSTYLTRQGIALNYDMHSSLSAPTVGDLGLRIKQQIDTVHEHLKSCQTVMLTYGTALVYERVDTGEAVANCHRMPAVNFKRRLSTTDEIVGSFQNVLQPLLKLNSGIHIILTVSPVRHVKDTLALNSVSKATLRLACHQLAEALPQVDYFPAYELLMDDLRDYRFYKEDLIHPTAMAEDYIWEKFSGAYFDDDTRAFLSEWQSIRQAIQHRPFHGGSEAHQQFIQKTIDQLQKFRHVVSVDEEIKLLSGQMTNQKKTS